FSFSQLLPRLPKDSRSHHGRILPPGPSGGRNIRTKGRNEQQRTKCLREGLCARTRTSLSQGPSGSGSGAHRRSLCPAALPVLSMPLGWPGTRFLSAKICQNLRILQAPIASRSSQACHSTPSDAFNTVGPTPKDLPQFAKTLRNFPRPSAITSRLATIRSRFRNSARPPATPLDDLKAQTCCNPRRQQCNVQPQHTPIPSTSHLTVSVIAPLIKHFGG
ncbi:hypothetical protein B0H16DRAFT_871167, partial [Mycena metata]